VHESRQLCRAARERRLPEPRSRVLGLVRDLVGPHGVGKAFQRECTDVGEAERLASPQQVHHETAAQDLPRRGSLAQASRQHHGRADVVALVRQRLPHVQPDAQAEPLARRGPPRLLLHRDRAAHGVGDRCEHGHQPIAEPLHLPAAVARDGILQHLPVRPQNTLRPLVTHPVQQLGRVRQVGEEQRHRRRGHGPGSYHPVTRARKRCHSGQPLAQPCTRGDPSLRGVKTFRRPPAAGEQRRLL
jgi:hypothetical protein